jgi:hypothetical protein
LLDARALPLPESSRVRQPVSEQILHETQEIDAIGDR